MTNKKRPRDAILGTIFLLQRKPRTIRELCELQGVHRNSIAKHIERLEAEGLVEKRGHDFSRITKPPAIYGMVKVKEAPR